jgi:hypothetical protein
MLYIILTLAVPLIIVLGVVRLIATEPYLAFEYGKADFPADPFGFDLAQRSTHAADNIAFVTRNLPLANLAGQKHESDPLYNERETKHMQDVQNIYQYAWSIWQIALVLAVLGGMGLLWRNESRLAFFSAVRSGGALTIGVMAVIGLFAVAAWQGWFAVFH